jgi:hypothetical protein
MSLIERQDRPDFTHPEYDKYKDVWQTCRDVWIGDTAVKKAGVRYLPALTEQTTTEYAAYKQRALFYGATRRTVTAMVGAIMRKPPVVDADIDTSRMTLQGDDLITLSSNVLEAIIVGGRVSLLVDVDKAGRPYVATYPTETLINWVTDGDGKPLMLVYREQQLEQQGRFASTHTDVIRVCYLDDGIYRQDVYVKEQGGKDEWILTDTITPTILGRTLDYIPAVTMTPANLSCACGVPPIFDLVNVNLSHYRTSADLEHGRHYTALPVACLAGFPTDNTYRIGSSVAWVSEDPEAKAYYLEYTGQGLGSLENAMEEKEKQMAILGTRLLDVPKASVEAAETLKSRNAGEHNILATLAHTMSRGMSVLLNYYARWGVDRIDDISVTYNTDFNATTLDPKDITALVQAYQAGAISWDTLFYNLKRGEVIPDNVDKEDERRQIEEVLPVA